MTEQAFEYDRYLIEQLVRPIVNLYRVTPLAAGETPAGPPVAFARQKRMAFREDIRFFADENETQEVFRIKARRVIDVGGRYDVHDAAGDPIGVLEHQFGKSLLRTTWRILSPRTRSSRSRRRRTSCWRSCAAWSTSCPTASSCRSRTTS